MLDVRQLLDQLDLELRLHSLLLILIKLEQPLATHLWEVWEKARY